MKKKNKLIINKQARLHLLLLGYCCFFGMASFAQEKFSFKASITAVDSTGFYQLPLPLNILGKCQETLSDIRLKDSDNKEISFYIDAGNPLEKNELLALPILSKAIMKDKKMHVTIKNTEKTITQLALQIQNNYASRTVNINGSNDGKEWFIIRDNVTVNSMSDNKDGSYIFTINLPVSNAAYFDIAFNDKELLPVNILQAGTYKYYVSPVLYDTVQTISIIQKDSSNKTSYLSLLWNEAYPIEQIKLLVQGPKYFRREVLIAPQTAKETTALLQANENNWWPIKAHSKQINLQILNDDNPPLEIISAKGIVRKYTLYAWLQKNTAFTLYFGDSLARQPHYDLVYFKDLVKENATTLSLNSVKNNEVEKTTAPVATSRKPFIWLAMGVVLLILLFFTFRLAGEVKNRQA